MGHWLPQTDEKLARERLAQVFRVTARNGSPKLAELFNQTEVAQLSVCLAHQFYVLGERIHQTFLRAGKPLEATNVLQHSISTVDDSPIFSRQYRYPPVHKEEGTRQVDELLKSKINEISQSSPVWIVPKKNPILKEKLN